MGTSKSVLIPLLLILCAGAAPHAYGKGAPDTVLIAPPEPLPVYVQTSFHLLDLTSVSERAETFTADIYLGFTWRDRRLSFPSTRKDEKKIYTEKAAEDKLREIWWPEVEFVNTSLPQITNRSLFIHPDGTVEYLLGVSSTFRSKLDLRRFPFDQQVLTIRIQSFLWNNATVRFVPDLTRCSFSGGDTSEDLVVKGVASYIHLVRMENLKENYSEFVAAITAKRNCVFYVWRIFFPAILLMVMSCTVYFINVQDLHDRATLCLTCLLACIATQFALSLNLPRIPYLTPIDKLYMVTYSCIALGVVVSTVENIFHRRNHPHAEKFNRFARWFVPLLYALLVGAVIFV